MFETDRSLMVPNMLIPLAPPTGLCSGSGSGSVCSSSQRQPTPSGETEAEVKTPPRSEEVLGRFLPLGLGSETLDAALGVLCLSLGSERLRAVEPSEGGGERAGSGPSRSHPGLSSDRLDTLCPPPSSKTAGAESADET